jgi:hypothetical protein
MKHTYNSRPTGKDILEEIFAITGIELTYPIEDADSNYLLDFYSSAYDNEFGGK